MLRTLSSAVAAGMLAVVGSVGLAVPTANAGTEAQTDFDLHAVCKPDEHHVRLAIRNDSAEDEKFKLKKKGDDSSVTGTAKAGEHTFVTVKWDSPEDTWILHIDDQWIKEKVDSPKACEKKPTEKPTLPVTGASSATWMGIGLGMLGVGAAALLFVAYRARRLGD